MKKMLLFCVLLICSNQLLKAQLQKGNVLVGADIANLDLDLGSGNTFSMTINPKAAWFIHDNVAVGGYVTFGLSTAKDAGTSILYGVGALGRYYVNNEKVNILRKSRWFAEGNVGIEGDNPAVGNNTNGLGLGIGPGLAYFITPNISLEALLKYNLIVGFGSTAAKNHLNLDFGFSIYLPGKKLQSEMQNMKK